MKNNNHNNATTRSNQPDNQRNETTTNNHSHNTTRTNHETRTNQPDNLINDYSNLSANGQDINWLIFESGETPYSIAKQTGVPDGNLYLVKNGERSINNLSLSVASKLTAYAIKLQGQQGAGTNKDD